MSRFRLVLSSVLIPCTVYIAGCAGTENDFQAEPVVLSTNPQKTGDQQAEILRRQFQQLVAAAKDDDLMEMKRVLSLMGGDNLPGWAKERVAYYRANLRARMLFAEKKIVVLFTASSPFYAVGDAVRPRFRIENRTKTEISIPASGDRAMVHMTLRSIDQGLLGYSHRNQVNRNFNLGQSMVVPAGEHREIADPPFIAFLAAGSVYRTLIIEGRLMLGGTRIMVGGEMLPLKSVPIQKVELKVFNKGFRKIRANPITYLEKALASGKPQYHKVIYLAANFMPPGLHQKAGDMLVNKLETITKQDNLARAIMQALKVITTFDLPILNPNLDSSRWVKAWRRR